LQAGRRRADLSAVVSAKEEAALWRAAKAGSLHLEPVVWPDNEKL
jgi:hypothetical protein